MVRRRGSVKLQFIMDRTQRKRTLEKRLPVLLKKTSEFAVLCDVPTCLVAYLPGEDQPVTWPSPYAAADMLRRYNEVGESQRFKHKLDGAEFVAKLVDKKKAELATVQRQIRDKEINLLVVDFLAGCRGSFADLSPEAFAALEWMVESKLRTVDARLQELRGGAILPPLPAQVELYPHEEMVQPPPVMMAPTPLLQDDVQFPVVLDASDGSGLPTTEELQAAGIFTSGQASPSFNDIV